jgi:UDPglucose--hexose-1-phosphate uridylyltransferase
MADMDSKEILDVLAVCKERISFHISDNRIKTVVLFKNYGREAGASLVHSHTQLMALPVVPDNVASQLESFKACQEEKGSCILCDTLKTEGMDGARIVLDDMDYMVLAPFAAVSPFQLNIVPKTHSHDFSLSDGDALNRLAQVLADTLRRLRSVLGEHPWNMVLHNAPANLDEGRDTTVYHWFIEIAPRLTNPAGFEMGSGYSINTVAPEECAALLRECRM